MKKTNLLLIAAAFAIPAINSFTCNQNKSAPVSTPTKQTAAIVEAATAFLQSLTADQRSKILFDFKREKTAVAAKFERSGNLKGGSKEQNNKPPSPPIGAGKPLSQRPPNRGNGSFGGFAGEQFGPAVWSNFPVSDVPRPGLQIGTFDKKQRQAAMHLLELLLSESGLKKVMETMGSDQALADGGTQFAAGTESYTLAIFGTPDLDKAWMVQFGGHHLALNIVIAGPQGALTPALTGAQPAIYQSNGKTVRALAAENDKAFALLDALDTSQRSKAILNYSIGDLVLGPGHDGEVIIPEGLKASEMTAKQKEMLLELIGEWAGIINNAYAEARMKEITAGINDTYFAWSGPVTRAPGKNGSAYYRIQGPHVIIEFSPQGVGGDLTMHVHTIYRDPLNNYGNALQIDEAETYLACRCLFLHCFRC